MNIETARLRPVLSMVEKAMVADSFAPVLNHVLFQSVSDDDVRLSGTDLDIEVQCLIKGVCCDNISGTVPLAALKSAMIGSEALSIMTGPSVSDGVVLWADDDVTTRTPSFTAPEFPTLTDTSEQERLSLKRRDLQRLLGQAAYAASHSETRYYLNGICLTLEQGCVTAVATDGHRLCRVTGSDVTNFTPFIIPNKAVSVLTGLLSQADEVIEVTRQERWLTFKLSDTLTVRAKHIDGTFPDYHRVLPDLSEYTSMRVDGAEFIYALRRAREIGASAGCEAKGERVYLDYHDGKLLITGETEGGVEVQTRVSAECDAPFVHCAINANFLLSAVCTMKGRGLTLLLPPDPTEYPGSPILLESEDARRTDVLMPMRYARQKPVNDSVSAA